MMLWSSVCSDKPKKDPLNDWNLGFRSTTKLMRMCILCTLDLDTITLGREEITKREYNPKLGLQTSWDPGTAEIEMDHYAADMAVPTRMRPSSLNPHYDIVNSGVLRRQQAYRENN
jgi:hypothetical protein